MIYLFEKRSLLHLYRLAKQASGGGLRAAGIAFDNYSARPRPNVAKEVTMLAMISLLEFSCLHSSANLSALLARTSAFRWRKAQWH